MKPDPSDKTADAIIGKSRSTMPISALEWPAYLKCRTLKCRARHGPETDSGSNCLAFVFADLPDDGSNVAITCPVSGHLFYASVSERL